MTEQNDPAGVAQAVGMREALEPFAKISLWRDMYPDAKEDFLTARQLQGYIKVEDVRRARAALAAQPPAAPVFSKASELADALEGLGSVGGRPDEALQAEIIQHLRGAPAAPVETKPFSVKENLREALAEVRADIDAATMQEELATRVETTPVDGKFGTRLFAMSDAERDLVVRLLRTTPIVSRSSAETSGQEG